MYGWLADAVLVLHFGFVLFVIGGGLLALRWPWMPWVHVPAAIWGVAIEFGGWICPLTPLENSLRERAGETPYAGDFIARFLMPVMYPDGLTREMQLALGGVALLLNVTIYAIVLVRSRKRSVRSSRSVHEGAPPSE